jgi:hypothetical protein
MSSGPYIYEKLAQLLDQDRNVSHAQGLLWLLEASARKNGEFNLFSNLLNLLI